MSTIATQIKASDTPRSDTASLASCDKKLLCVHAVFARELERELADSETARRSAVEFALTESRRAIRVIEELKVLRAREGYFADTCNQEVKRLRERLQEEKDLKIHDFRDVEKERCINKKRVAKLRSALRSLLAGYFGLKIFATNDWDAEFDEVVIKARAALKKSSP